MNVEDKFIAIKNGLLEFAVLSIIAQRAVYAADILSELSATEFKTQEGTLYPLLSKLRRDALLQYEWRESDAGPPRKYYSLTGKGEKHLSELRDYWKNINNTITKLGK